MSSPSSEAAAPAKAKPLQLVKLIFEGHPSFVDKPSVEVDQEALSHLTERLRKLGAKKVAVVSVMGAFRTGKSFLLDLMLRYLRHGARCLAAGEDPDSGPTPPERGTDADGNQTEYPLPAWLTASGASIEGVDEADGFRFKGGMDACTEGIWVWSEPFLKQINGEPVGLLLMDTQGAWDGNMTKEQSATIFGLTAVLSSKQIYNISVQIQEDKVENLTFFMRFAQTAIQKASLEMAKDEQLKEHIDRPFQSLDFLVRDFKHFRDDDSMEGCKKMMAEHMARHTDPKRVKAKDTAEILTSMFQNMGCFCLPHPGFAIEKETWKGGYKDISNDFIRMVDTYVREVFSINLEAKRILGGDLTPLTFGLIVNQFVSAFADASPVAMTFTQAITNSTVLLAKEQAMKSFQRKMEKALSHGGLEEAEFQQLTANKIKEVQSEFEKVSIFGDTAIREDTWSEIKENLEELKKRFHEDNLRKLEKALAVFANISILGLAFFALDRISDYACDWWSQTCVEVSKILLLCWVLILGYVGFNVYLLLNKQGKIATASAAGELWKEMVRLVGVYSELAKSLKFKELLDLSKEALSKKVDSPNAASGKVDGKEDPKGSATQRSKSAREKKMQD